MQHARPALQKLYFDLSQTRAAYENVDFSQPPAVRFHSRRGEAQSVALFLPDRVVVIEEWVDIPMADFIEKVRLVADKALAELGIGEFLAQTATVRSTFSLSHFTDARVFLIDHMCQQADRIGPHFQRPVLTSGLRFVLPETPDHPGTLHVIIESYKRTVSEVYVEVKGVFANQKITVETLELGLENIRLCRAFIRNNIFSYLDQFDTPKEGLV